MLKRMVVMAFLLLFAGATIALAQNPTPVPVPAPDWIAELVTLLTSAAVVAFATRILVWLSLLLLPKVPKAALPILAFGLPLAADYLGALPIDNPVVVAVVGLVAIGLREIVDKVLTKGLLKNFAIAGQLTVSDGAFLKAA